MLCKVLYYNFFLVEVLYYCTCLFDGSKLVEKVGLESRVLLGWD